uniref:Uncharacterized protein n=1 Tax=Arundo donax TaxID=35708 RepID=A0A0A9F0A4_ARUDO
MIHCFCVNCEL